MTTVKGERYVIGIEDDAYPKSLLRASDPPKCLYVIGNLAAIQEGLAVVGARKATPYGLSCTKEFAGIAAQRGVVIISGGARGCDTQAHRAALDKGALTVVFMGPGLDNLYPSRNIALFQEIVDKGGAIVSEHPWETKAVPYTFRMRNRLIAALAKATLIVEAGLPSGTFTTADYAIDADREVWVIPGSVTSQTSHGANTLIYQGAIPIIDETIFKSHLQTLYELEDAYAKEKVLADESKPPSFEDAESRNRRKAYEEFSAAVKAAPLSLEDLRDIAVAHFDDSRALKELMMWVAVEQREGRIAKFPDGRYGCVVNEITVLKKGKCVSAK